MNAYRNEKIENWVGDFCLSTSFSHYSTELKEAAPQLLFSLLSNACFERDLDPSDIGEPELRAALLGPLAQLALPEAIRINVPALCNDFLSDLEDSGRLSGGRDLGRYLGALHRAYDDASASKSKPIEKVASKLGRNDPCPCGSGKKYKKCCKSL